MLVTKRMRYNVEMLAIVTLYLALGIAYGIANPLFESPDELRHFSFVRQLALGNGLPVQSEAVGISEYHQPPLYYLLGAAVTFWIDTGDFPELQKRNPFWGEDIMYVGRDNKNQYIHSERENLPYRNTVLAVHVLRLVSTLFGAVTVVLSYLIAARIFPSNRAIALGSAAFVAFNPQFVYINASVSNDSLLATISTAAMYMLAGAPRIERLSVRGGLALGILMAAAVLTKLTGLLLIPMAAIALGLCSLRYRSVAPALKVGGLAFGSALLLSVWWFIRNLLLYGEWSGMDTMQRIWGTNRWRPLDTTLLSDALPAIWKSFWAHFGSGNVPVDEFFYQALLVLVAAACAGLVLGFSKLVKRQTLGRDKGLAIRRNEVAQPAYTLVLLVCWLLLVSAALARYVQTAGLSEFGRFLFPAISSIAILISLGLVQLASTKRAGLLVTFSAVGLFAFSLIALVAYLVPAYGRPPALRDSELASFPNQAIISFGDRAEVMANEFRAEGVATGQTLEVDLYWRATRRMNEDYVAFIHLFTIGDNRLVAQRDTYSGGGTFPTSAWIPGEVFRDTYRIKIPASFEAPALLRADLGLYSPDSMARLPLVSGAPGLGRDAAYLGTVRIPSGLKTAPQNVHAVFEDGVVLVGYELDSSGAENDEGRVLSAKLFWTTETEVRGDYTVFVHLIGDDGKPITQDDGKPARRNYPTWAWRPGEIVPDTHPLRLPANAPRENYQIVVGLYDSNTMNRLAVTSPDQRVATYAFSLGKISFR